jgi:hypothetical protein
MLFFHVFAKLHSRRIHPTKDASPERASSAACPTQFLSLSPKSHGIISFTDSHPLNSVVSYRYKNIGGQGAPPPNPRPPRPICQFTLSTEKQRKCPNSAQFWCNLSPLDATLLNPLICVANKGLAAMPKSFKCNTYKKHRGQGGANGLVPSSLIPPLSAISLLFNHFRNAHFASPFF